MCSLGVCVAAFHAHARLHLGEGSHRKKVLAPALESRTQHPLLIMQAKAPCSWFPFFFQKVQGRMF